MSLADRGLPSTEQQCLEAVRTVLISLKVAGFLDGKTLPDDQIAVRENWYTDETPHRGYSVHSAGESYDSGPIGLHDVAYGCAVSAADLRSTNAGKPNHLPGHWIAVARRRFQDARIPVGDELNGGVRRHQCVVTEGNPQKPRRKPFGSWLVRQIIVWCWVREELDQGE